MGTLSTSFRTSPETLSSLDIIAKDLGRSRNWVLNKAVQDFLEHQAWFKQQVQEGIKAADNGEFATEEEMTKLFSKFGA
ncbi:CopG family ribbon-helix-helix protein [Maridesulfovibrio frigidus]|uniref:CopG family ribbon-helix-helix protein n=1 Tax=Maridesulfovibrio frigidus TaxID=340956 RepID=UPI0004E21461|nr:CopG family transcriptional regulator [Maridesulfovibrio frigidus]